MITSIKNNRYNVTAIEISERNVIITFQSPFCPMVRGKKKQNESLPYSSPKRIDG